MPNDYDMDSALGSDDYEYLQEYMEEYGKHMNEKRFYRKYKEKSMAERLQEERTADVFEIEERRMMDEESENNDR